MRPRVCGLDGQLRHAKAKPSVSPSLPGVASVDGNGDDPVLHRAASVRVEHRGDEGRAPRPLTRRGKVAANHWPQPDPSPSPVLLSG